jgi:hypothetical protein
MKQVGGGSPLDRNTRSEMEGAFGQDFGDVRIHAGAGAGRLSSDLNALAFTSGKNVYFAPGQYAPETREGKRLLAHELAHVVQQRSAYFLASGRNAEASFEREADSAADRVVRGESVKVAPRPAAPAVLRKAGPKEGEFSGCYGPPPGKKKGWSATKAGTVAHMAIQEKLTDYLVKNLNSDGKWLEPQLPKASKTGKSMGRVDLMSLSSKKNFIKVGEIKSTETGSQTAYDDAMHYIHKVQVYANRYRAALDDGDRDKVLRRSPNILDWSNKFFDPWLDRKHTAKDSSPDATTYAKGELGRYLRDVGGSRIGSMANGKKLFAREGTLPGTVLYWCEDEAAGTAAMGKGKKFTLARRTHTTRKKGKKGNSLYWEMQGEPDAQMVPGVKLVKLVYDESAEGELLDTGYVLLEPNFPLAAKGAKAQIKLPINNEEASLSATVEVPFKALKTTVKAEITAPDGQVQADIKAKPGLPLLKDVELAGKVSGKELEASATLSPEQVKLPIPGVKVEKASGFVGYKKNGGFEAGGEVDLAFSQLGTGHLAVKNKGDKLNATGDLTLKIPGFEEVKGRLGMEDGKVSGQATLTTKSFPKGLPLEGGSITVKVDDGAVSADGQVGVKLGPVGKGALKMKYENGKPTIGAEVEITKVPGLKGGKVSVNMVDGKLEGEGEVPIDAEKLPGLNGNVKVAYKENRWSGTTKIGYQKGDLGGEVEVNLQQDEKGGLAISGSGEVNAKIAPWLQGKVRVDLLPTGDVKVAGGIKAPNEVTLFPKKEFKQEKSLPKLTFPLWGFSVPVVGSVGINAFIEGGGGVRATFGPGVLRNIGVEGSFGTAEGEKPTFDITGEFNLPAGAEAYMYVAGGLSLGAAIAELRGGLRLNGGVGAMADLSVQPHIGYNGKDYYFKGDAKLDALAYLRFSGEAFAELEALWSTVWEDKWPLFDWVYPLGLNVSLQAGIDYTFGQDFAPKVDFKADELDPMKVVKSAVPGPGASPKSGPGGPPAPKAEMKTQPVPGAKGGGGGGQAKTSAGPAASTPAAPPMPASATKGGKKGAKPPAAGGAGKTPEAKKPEARKPEAKKPAGAPERKAPAAPAARAKPPEPKPEVAKAPGAPEAAGVKPKTAAPPPTPAKQEEPRAKPAAPPSKAAQPHARIEKFAAPEWRSGLRIANPRGGLTEDYAVDVRFAEDPASGARAGAGLYTEQAKGFIRRRRAGDKEWRTLPLRNLPADRLAAGAEAPWPALRPGRFDGLQTITTGMWQPPQIGDELEVNLDMKSQALDATNGKKVLQEHRWRVAGRAEFTAAGWWVQKGREG